MTVYIFRRQWIWVCSLLYSIKAYVKTAFLYSWKGLLKDKLWSQLLKIKHKYTIWTNSIEELCHQFLQIQSVAWITYVRWQKIFEHFTSSLALVPSSISSRGIPNRHEGTVPYSGFSGMSCSKSGLISGNLSSSSKSNFSCPSLRCASLVLYIVKLQLSFIHELEYTCSKWGNDWTTSNSLNGRTKITSLKVVPQNYTMQANHLKQSYANVENNTASVYCMQLLYLLHNSLKSK